jgi:hypothetical protein
MNFFTAKTTWSNAEFIPFKLCVASAYVLVGAYFHTFFRYHYVPVVVLFGVSTIWVLALWLKKMKIPK